MPPLPAVDAYSFRFTRSRNGRWNTCPIHDARIVASALDALTGIDVCVALYGDGVNDTMRIPLIPPTSALRISTNGNVSAFLSTTDTLDTDALLTSWSHRSPANGYRHTHTHVGAEPPIPAVDSASISFPKPEQWYSAVHRAYAVGFRRYSSDALYLAASAVDTRFASLDTSGGSDTIVAFANATTC